MNPVIDKCPPRYRFSRARSALAVAICGVFLLAGCASTPEPTAELQAAQQAIADAERAQAAEHAAGELSQARTKLASANTAVQDKDMDEAKRLAQQARVDAELAAARTAAVKAKAVNEEMKRSTQTLIEEMGREADQGTTGTPGTTGMGTTGTGTPGAPGTGTATTDPTMTTGSTDPTGTTGGTQ
jgi:multidrug efflux pump subunit AcrA (membrane-fusion protein)